MSAPTASAALARRIGFVEPQHRAAVGAGDNEEVRIPSRRDRRPDLREILVERNDRLVVEVAAFLREPLVFDMQAGDAAPLVFPNRAGRIEFVAVTGIGIGNDRHIDGGGDAAGVVGHLGHGEEPVVRITQRRRGPGAGHVNRAEAGLSDRSRRYAVIGAGCNRQAAAPQQLRNCRPRLMICSVLQLSWAEYRNAIAGSIGVV